MKVFALRAPPSPPGIHLGRRGADDVLDGTLYTRAAYSVNLTAGTTYKIDLVKRADGCMELRLFSTRPLTVTRSRACLARATGWSRRTLAVGGAS